MISTFILIFACTPVQIYGEDTPEMRLQVYATTPDACFDHKWDPRLLPEKPAPRGVDWWFLQQRGPANYDELPYTFPSSEWRGLASRSGRLYREKRIKNRRVVKPIPTVRGKAISLGFSSVEEWIEHLQGRL